MNSDRYNLWWTGPPDEDTFKPATWGAMHRETSNAIFTMAVIQGGKDVLVSSPHDLILFWECTESQAMKVILCWP